MATLTQTPSVQLNQSPVRSSSLTGLTNPQGIVNLPSTSTVSSLVSGTTPSLNIPASPRTSALTQIPGFAPVTPGTVTTSPVSVSSIGTTPPSLRVSQPTSTDVTQLLTRLSPVPSPARSPGRTPSPIVSSPGLATTIPVISTVQPPTSPVRLPTVTSPVVSPTSLTRSVRLPTISPTVTSTISPTGLVSLPTISPTMLPSVRTSTIRLPTVSPTSSVVLPTVTPEVARSGIGLSTSTQSYGTPTLSPLFNTPSQLVDEKAVLTKKSIVMPSSGTLQFSTISGPVTDSSVESQLASKGYITTDRVLTKTPSGQVEGRYLKTINERGQTAFVELDTEGFVSVQPEDLTMIESKSASKVPMSVKVGTLECASSDVCGVAFECEGELCTLTRENPSMAPTELVLHTVSKPSERSIVEEGTPIAYPIVRLSEINADNEQVVKSVDAATARIRNASYKACVEDMRKTDKSCENLKSEFKTLSGTIDLAFRKLGSSIQELEKYRTGYDNVPPQNDEQREKYRTLAFNLRRRHDMMVDLLRICVQVSTYSDQLRFVGEKFSELTRHVDEAYKGIEYVYKE